MLRGDWIRASIGVSVFVSESICCKRVLFECVNWKKSSLHFHLFECLLLICFGIVCNIFSQLLCFLFVSVALNDAYSVVILVLFHQFCFFYIISFCSVHIRIYYKYPVEAKKRENLPWFFLFACLFRANLSELCLIFPISISTFC